LFCALAVIKRIIKHKNKLTTAIMVSSFTLVKRCVFSTAVKIGVRFGLLYLPLPVFMVFLKTLLHACQSIWLVGCSLQVLLHMSQCF